MAQRNRRRQQAPQPERRPETRKQQRQRARDRERNQRLYAGFGAILGVVLLLVLIGALAEFVFEPRSAFAQVGDDTITVREFRQRTLLEKANLESQLIQLTNLEQQFGGGGFFTSQINQIQTTLSDNISLGISVLNQMIDERVIEQAAAERGVSVSDEEIDERLREEVAAGQQSLTESQATATTEAGQEATATAELFTPTPSPTIDLSSTITATLEPLPTTEPPPLPPLLEPVSYTEGLDELESNIDRVAGMSIDDYRNVLRYQILREKMVEEVSADIAPTETQVNARHILLSVDQTVTDTLSTTDTALLTDGALLTDSAALTDTALTASDNVTASDSATVTDATTATDALSNATAATDTSLLTSTETATDAEVVTGADVVTNTENVTGVESTTSTQTVSANDTITEAAVDALGAVATDTVTATTATTDTATSSAATSSVDLTGTSAMTTPATEGAATTDTGALTSTGALTGLSELASTNTPTDTVDAPTSYSLDEALALAQDLRQQILDGADFATLAAEYSDDPGSAAQGGDLGFFGRERMVAPFEEAAFALEPGEVSEPVVTDFGVHLIQVVERDENRAKDESQLQQEQQQAFQEWLAEQRDSVSIERPTNLESALPRGL